jgi:two-component system sensor histidine kinase PilS (NtrC family)
LNRLVEDILRVAWREAPMGDSFDLVPFLERWLEELVRDRPAAKSRVQLTVPASAEVRFEPSHLRQVLYNLVDNALRYSGEAPGAVRLIVEPAPAVALWVIDDGPGVSEALRNSLFEPFHTTHVAGTGLGLYIAREFCLANRSRLVYDERTAADGSRTRGFVIRFTPEEAESPVADFLDTMLPND